MMIICKKGDLVSVGVGSRNAMEHENLVNLQEIQKITKFKKKKLQNERLDEHYTVDISEM